VNSHVPHDVPARQPYAPAAPAHEEEQRHHLHDPRGRGERGQLAEQVADAQSAGVDGGE